MKKVIIPQKMSNTGTIHDIASQHHSSEEIVRDAQKRQPRDKKQASKWFGQSRAAQKSGGPCPVCGWKDGDGLKSCFYSPEIGAVTHENSIQAAKKTMTPAQASLVNLRQKLLYTSAEAREEALKPYLDRTDYVERMRAESVATEYPYRTWVQKRQNDYQVFCYEPHPGCGGIQVLVEPYHLRCSKCGVEVRLWEHGIDYDIG